MMHSNGYSSTLAAHAVRCRVCGAGSGSLVDVYGAAVCEACLRRIDANPREKRQIMFTMGDALYW